MAQKYVLRQPAVAPPNNTLSTGKFISANPAVGLILMD